MVIENDIGWRVDTLVDYLFGRPLVTEVQPLENYSPAEDYHQDFFEKNPTQGYCLAVAAPKVAKFRKTFTELTRR